jgi:xylulokinase
MSRGEAFVGIDLGTSSVKAVLLGADGADLGKAQVHYDVKRPHADWAEQDPEAWWAATSQAVRAILAASPGPVGAVGLSGQMHGLVLVDDAGSPLRSAIIWSDARSGTQVAQWQNRLDASAVERQCGFPVSTGMAAVSLAWVRDHEPDVYRRARAALMPKDYIRFKLTGLLATEPTDAGGSLLYDIRAERPASNILTAVGLRDDMLPEIVPSLSVAGAVHRAASEETGIPAGTAVSAGGGDQAMAAIALGLRDPSRAAVAISSGGTVFKRTYRPLDPSLGLHVLPDARRGEWLAMGVVLSAGLSIDWLAREVFGGVASSERITELMGLASRVAPGAEGLLFSSQLGGVRTPIADESVRGALVGLGFGHGQPHITRAMVEGVCIALSRSLVSLRTAGEHVSEIVISGGAARFPLWQRTLSDVTSLPVHVSTDIEHSAIGAAIGAAEAVARPLEYDPAMRIGATVEPDPDSVEIYRDLAEHLSSVEHAVARLNRKWSADPASVRSSGAA